MKKFANILFVLCILATGISKAWSMTFEEAFEESNRTPMLVLVYAEWADNYQNYINAFKKLEDTYAENFNYVELNIANPDTKFFNSRYHIYPNLPYVLMFRDGGKVSRYIQKECVTNDSCVNSRIKSFLQ